MRIVIAGAGEVGTHLAKMLSSEEHDLVVIDNDVDRLKSVSSALDVLTIEGNANSITLLKESKISKADLFIGVTYSEDVNIMIFATLLTLLLLPRPCYSLCGLVPSFKSSRARFRHLRRDPSLLRFLLGWRLVAIGTLSSLPPPPPPPPSPHSSSSRSSSRSRRRSWRSAWRRRRSAHCCSGTGAFPSFELPVPRERVARAGHRRRPGGEPRSPAPPPARNALE